MLQIPSGEFAAYLFDCDGTIADSMPVHFLAWAHALQPYGGSLSEQRFYELAGVPTDEIVRILNREQSLRMPVDGVVDRKEARYFEMLAQVEPIHEVVEQIRLHAGKKPMAVVSGSPRITVEKTLESLGLRSLFEVLVCAGEYAKGKPHPDPFLTAAKKLGVDPTRCLVFEDARAGIESAKAAGMQWVWVPGPSERIKSGTD
jgi:HAD superfamily hydrolase (TIGR01509 family)